MQKFNFSIENEQIILALGAESAGNFSVLQNGTIYFSQDFGDLLNEQNFLAFKIAVLKFLGNKKIKPDIILSDLHPELNTTFFAQELAKKYKAQYLPVQHHIAHVFSALGDEFIHNTSYKIPDTFFGIACDGTGLGFDGKIWGGEIFNIQHTKYNIQYTRIGHLENQIMIGGEIVIKQPARLLISILAKITRNKKQATNKAQKTNYELQTDFIYSFVKKYYSENEFEVLWNQLEQNFNCIETSSTARILDAVSVLLGFSKNERLSKHGPVTSLEQNSGKPYVLKPVLEFDEKEKIWILKTTPLFEYLIKNLHKDKKRLGATAQKYIADGIWEICHQSSAISRRRNEHESQLPMTNDRLPVFFAGGMANNPIMSKSLTSHGTYTNKKIPRGDAGISFGQIFYHILANPRD